VLLSKSCQPSDPNAAKKQFYRDSSRNPVFGTQENHACHISTCIARSRWNGP